MIQPTRTEPHRTENKAIRHILNSISEDWLIRGLDERDYGIDLMFEVFNGKHATGRMAFVESKGTEEKFKKNDQGEIILNGFPTKTINYALKIRTPFFAFYTSNATRETYFIWLQRYAITKLSQATSKWKEQETNTLYFPKENSLSNHKKIEKILLSEQTHSQLPEFLRNSRPLKDRLGFILLGNLEEAEGACRHASAICSCPAVFEFLKGHPYEIDYVELTTTLREILETNILNQDNKDYLKEVEEKLEGLDNTLLDAPELRMLESEMTGIDPEY